MTGKFFHLDLRAPQLGKDISTELSWAHLISEDLVGRPEVRALFTALVKSLLDSTSWALMELLTPEVKVEALAGLSVQVGRPPGFMFS
jgi:hypothetical protein